MSPKRTIILIGLAAITLMAVIGLTGKLASSASLTDAQKREKVFKMYAGYQKKFPEVQDIDPQLAMELTDIK